MSNVIKQLASAILSTVGVFPLLRNAVIELSSIDELCRVFQWTRQPNLAFDHLHQFDYVEDVNERRLRDAETIGTVMCNSAPKIALEIGTAQGHSTALMALNAPEAQVHTVNIPPEELLAGEGGRLTTMALEREKIGSFYRERGVQNITQILANTAHWEPNIGTLDVAFIDGCHDADFVYNDTRKILKSMKTGSFVMWHDFNPATIYNYRWHLTVAQGVERLLRDGLVRGRIFHVRDAWVGVYRVS